MNNYQKNLKAFKNNHTFLIERLQGEIEKTPWFFPYEHGFNIKTDQNEIIKGTANNNPDELTKNYQMHSDEASIVFGIGDGSLLYSICQHKKKLHVVLVYESQLDIIAFALERYDFSKWIKNGTLLFVADKEQNELSSLVSVIDNGNVIQDWIFFAEPYVINKRSVYGQVFDETQRLINHLRCNTGTLMQAGKIIAKNDIENLPYVIRHNGINVLKEAFKDKPAILVSTGPSLSKNIHYIKEIQDKVIIIAVGQALRILQAYDITPDFICTVDFGEVNMSHFVGLMDSSVPLIALNRSFAPLLKEWRGPKFISSSINAGCENTVVGLLDDRGSLEQGGSVAHFALGVALHFGCNPIIITGQDLALTDGLSHNINADSSGFTYIDNGEIKWSVHDPRSNLLNKEVHSMGPAVQVPGYFGTPVITNIGLASFITAFEDIIKRRCKDITVINATEGGARIPETKQMALTTAIKKYCIESLDKSIIEKYKGLKDDWQQDIDKALSLIDSDMQILNEIIIETEKGLESNSKLSRKLSRNQFEQLLLENAEHSNKAAELSDKSPLLKLHIYHASRAIQSRELKVKGSTAHLLKHKDDFQTRIARNKLILETARDAAKDLKQSYEKTQSILQHCKDGDISEIVSPINYIPSVTDAEDYFKTGNFARPYLDALKLNDQDIAARCIEMREAKIAAEKERCKDHPVLIEYNELVHEAHQLGLKQRDFKQAFELLDTAEKLLPERFEAQWGRATALFYCARYQEALEQYDKLIKKYPDNQRLKFEKYLVMIEINAEQGLADMKQFLAESDQFQYFWRHIAELYRASDPVKAKAAYELYLSKFPDDIEAKAAVESL